VRIRGGDFYRDRNKATEPLWSELERLGIRPGGVDETAAEPPPSADMQKTERADDDVVVPVSASPADVDAHSDTIDADSEPAMVKQGEFDVVVRRVSSGARESA
jgi:hypothetical protein